MFKSVYAKYLTTFIMIILVSFTIISLMITSVINNYSETVNVDIMKGAADVSREYVEEKLADGTYGNLDSVLRGESKDLEYLMKGISASSGSITLLVADINGDILLAEGSDEFQVSENGRIPKALMEEINSEHHFFNESQLAEVFNSPRHIYAEPLHAPDGHVCGAVFVCASSGMMSDLLQEIIESIVVVILLVLLAVLIAVFITTERIISPLRDISKAAKSFAAGKFDVRVPVKGRDEIAELAVTFNNMAESLNNYDTMRNTFMSNVSHDLRTPMTSIAGFVDGILDGVIPPEKHSYYLQIVSSETKRLSRLVSTLLDLSRIQAGERKFNMVNFDICEVGREIIISLEQKLNDKKLQVEFDVDEDNIAVYGDRDAIYQVLYNLCDNAVKFASEGGEFKISVKKQKNKKVIVSVYNEGQGISDADLPYVFERFYKSDKSRGLNKSGVGLGLFISKTIIEAHNEKIWAESEFERNCLFNFTMSPEHK